MPIPLAPPTPAFGPGVPGTLLHAGTLMIGDVVLGGTDEFGVEWILESLKGWDDPPATTGATDQRTADHGGWNSPAYYQPRLVEVVGSLIASDWGGATDGIDRLMGAVPLSDPDWMYVDEGARQLQARVRQDSQPLMQRLGGWARFSLSLLAADPRRYGADETTLSTGLPQTTGGLTLPVTFPLTIGATTFSGRIQAENLGNMATRPVMAISGPCPPATITHIGSGKRLLIPESVTAGRTLILDVDTRTALLDGTALRYVTGSWFDLEPGVNEISFEAAAYDADALLSLTYRSAWR